MFIRVLKIGALALAMLAAIGQPQPARAQGFGSAVATGLGVGAGVAVGYNLFHWLTGPRADNCWRSRTCGDPPWAYHTPGTWQYGPAPASTIWMSTANAAPMHAPPPAYGPGPAQQPMPRSAAASDAPVLNAFLADCRAQRGTVTDLPGGRKRCHRNAEWHVNPR